jgi:hypothetical protein
MKKGGKGVSIIHWSYSFGIGIYQGSVLQYGMHNDGSVEYLAWHPTAQGVLACGIFAIFRFCKDYFLGGLLALWVIYFPVS